MRYSRIPGPHYRRDEFGKLWIDGHFYMGPYRLPSMPPRIGLVDRTTGELLVLSHDGIDYEMVAPTRQMTDIHDYGKYDGPHSGDWKLYLDNGTLAFEYDPGYNSAKILTRRNFDIHVLEITADNTGQVVVTPYDL